MMLVKTFNVDTTFLWEEHKAGDLNGFQLMGRVRFEVLITIAMKNSVL